MAIESSLIDSAIRKRGLRLPSLDALAYSSMGLIVLLIGSWVPDTRITVAGLPLSSVILIIGALLATTAKIKRDALYTLMFLQVPLIILSVTIFWSTDPEYGLDKLTALIITGNIAFLLFNTVIERHGPEELSRLMVIYFGALLLLAIPYKLAFGFFDRQTPFFINGAIVFGRLMCIAAILSIFVFTVRKRMWATAIFCLAVVWTESKGPILAIVLTLGVLAMFHANAQQKLRIFGVAALFILSGIAAFNYFDLSVRDLGRLGVLISLATGDAGILDDRLAQGSLGARLEIWSKTIDLIPTVPLGTGLGGWAAAVDNRFDLVYPHNLFLELWSEGGVILGSFAAVPFCLFFLMRKNIFWFIALCLFLAQMVSGDLADARFMLVFCFLAYSASSMNLSRVEDSDVKWVTNKNSHVPDPI